MIVSNKKDARGVVRCLLLDSKYAPLARGILESPTDAQNLQVRVLDDKTDEVLLHEVIQVISMQAETPAWLGRIIRRRDDVVVLESMRSLGAEVRQNLRMPVQFESFAYPITGDWQGRVPVLSRDLSCGGISFYAAFDFAEGEQLEIVVPITANLLILKCQILKLRPSTGGMQIYAAKFVDMIDDEESRVREAVFSVQLKSRADTLRSDA